MMLLHAGEPLVETLELEAEARVINAHEVQDGRVQVIDVRSPLARLQEFLRQDVA